MNKTTQRALQAIENSKRAIWTSVEELYEEYANTDDEAKREKINDRIDELNNQIHILRKQAISVLDEDEEINNAIDDINKSAADLEKSARKINNVADAIRKGTGLVNKATKLVGKIAGIFS